MYTKKVHFLNLVEDATQIRCIFRTGLYLTSSHRFISPQCYEEGSSLKATLVYGITLAHAVCI